MLFNKIEKTVYCWNIWEGTIILCTIFLDPSCAEYPGKGFIRNLDNWIRFTVFEADIVARTMLFDEGVFKKKRFIFVAGSDIVESMGA